ncbi:polysaccharide biosynthesis/export family protein [Mucilaginibacter myungsuensis]|uniref:Polysaccharide biosynthesis/export family protein n=1 Tax=Mucilaginibacter myungsuensis TaxID=649104 RepID=A0A929PVJ2_9SPHI|nr:polysaccharide biosynthesis/export family protein [Mucilaginibacter myungsuensis]MBE9660380.1 polysaccharide biosynthesis/export family protein [Mucilaginibacter myungsuensis]MDN3600422.1 polysaccharide biosynthesis/export family protein [Mucilaginibacter myungsuensis]
MKKELSLNLSIICLFLVAIGTSCKSSRSLVYFQDVDRSKIQTQTIDNYNASVVQPGDVLQISVSSANPTATAAFNNSSTGAPTTKETTSASQGYLVDDAGMIKMPVLGNIKVAGSTAAQIHDLLIPKYAPYLKDAFVNIQLSNFKISVLGDVAHPGVFDVPNSRINVLEALSRSGDLAATANRDGLVLIREVAGERKIIPLDLTNSSVMQSPYYYLKNNDVLYVEPGKAKYATVSPTSRTLPIVLSIVSVLTIIFALTKN